MYGKIQSAFTPWSMAEYERHKITPKTNYTNKNEPFCSAGNTRSNNTDYTKDKTEETDIYGVLASALIYLIIALIFL